MASGLAAIVPKAIGSGVVSAIRRLSTAWWAFRFARSGRILELATPLTTAATRPSVMVYTSCPSMLVYGSHVGLPPLLHKFLLWTPGLLIASIAIGTLIGVLFIGRCKSYKLR